MNWLIVTLVLLVLLYVVVMVSFRMWKRTRVSEADKKFFNQHWNHILAEGNYSNQIMQADKLLDQMLKKRGFDGTLGDKLKKASKMFSDRNGLWEAHKLRNKIAHEVGFQVTTSAKNMAMEGFKKAFIDLGLIK